MFPFSDIYYCIKCYLEKKKWYRKWKGGKWSKQWIDPCRCYIWFQGWKREPASAPPSATYESYPDIGNRCEDCHLITYEGHRVVTDYSWTPVVHEEVTRYVEGVQLCGNCREVQLALSRKQW